MKNSITKKELIDVVASKAHLTHKASKEAVNAFLQGIKDAVKRDEKAVITGFGTFSLRHRKARLGRNPRTGEQISLSARKAPGFTPGKSFKKFVK